MEQKPLWRIVSSGTIPLVAGPEGEEWRENLESPHIDSSKKRRIGDNAFKDTWAILSALVISSVPINISCHNAIDVFTT